MTFFLSLSGSLYQNTALTSLTHTLPSLSPDELSNLIAGTSSAAYKNLSEASKAMVIPQITGAMRGVWLFFLCGAVLSFVGGWGLGVSEFSCAFGVRGEGGGDGMDADVVGVEDETRWCGVKGLGKLRENLPPAFEKGYWE